MTPTTELLAGLLDLADPRRPPHPDGPCTALCVPSCSYAQGPRTPSRPGADVPTWAPHAQGVRGAPTDLTVTGGSR